MRLVKDFLGHAFVGGVLIVLPIYLAVLLLLKGMQAAAGVVRPLAALLPDSLPAEGVLSLLLVLLICFSVGLAVRTSPGRGARERLERVLFDRLPGYSVFRGLTQRLTGTSDAAPWKPALAEIANALVPAFIIEELADGRFTVLVPSIPTPLAGAVYILGRERVHPVDVPFTQAVRTISQWGSGAKDLVTAMTSAGAG